MAMRTEHTPGNWTFIKNDPVTRSPYFVMSDVKAAICDIYVDNTRLGSKKKHALGNAMLISAAPDLLRELTEAVEVLKICETFINEARERAINGLPGKWTDIDTIDNIRLAIAESEKAILKTTNENPTL